MIRLWLHGVVAALITFALAVGAIAGQPRDNADIRAFFSAPDGCTAPCFLGIHPGVTRRDEALAVLQAQPWITGLQDDGDSIKWMWNGRQPAFISQLDSRFYAGRVDFRDELVTSISLPTAVRYGDFLALFGTPDATASVNNYGPSSISITRTFGFFDAGFEIEFTFRCPVRTRQDMWSKMVIVTYPNRPPSQYDVDRYQRWSC